MSALSGCERAAHEAFERCYRERCFTVNVDQVLLAFQARFYRPAIDDWQERRKALLTTACLELRRISRTLSSGNARNLVAEKYNGAPIGTRANGSVMRLLLSSVSLWRVYRLRPHLGSGSPDLTSNRGRSDARK